MTWEQWLALAALAVAVIALVVAASARAVAARLRDAVAEDAAAGVRDDDDTDDAHDAGDSGDAEPEPDVPAEPDGPRPPAVIVNPTKTDVERLRGLVDRTCAEVGLPAALWYETSQEDPGIGQTRRAVADGAGVVIAAGGDGTVRAVAEGLAGSHVPMGLLPLGTGNLLARNLDLPLSSDRQMITIALTGRDRPVDLGWLRTEPLTPEERRALHEDDDPLAQAAAADDAVTASAAEGRHNDDTKSAERIDGPLEHGRDSETGRPEAEHAFLVIGGMGFDAVMVGNADTDLKKRMGVLAYGVTGVKHLFDRKIRARILLGDSTDETEVEARSVMFANCGKLVGGAVLLPDAQFDDGWLDVAVIDTRGGIVGWADLTNRILLQGVGVRSSDTLLRHGRIDSRRARHVTVRTSRPHPVQVDGDVLGYASTVHARIEPDALRIRTVH